MKNRIVKFVVLAVVGFALGGAIAYLDLARDKPQVQTAQTENAPVDPMQGGTMTSEIAPTEQVEPAAPVAQATPMNGEFELVAETGEVTTHEDFNGLPKLVFFGFTHCPDVCPATLTKLTSVMSEFKRNMPILFITVDPERDTPEVLTEYTDMFDGRIIGFTGSQEQIDAAINNFKVYAARESSMDSMETNAHANHSADEDHNYLMQHSSYIYMMGPDNELLDVINSNDSAEEILEQINAQL